MRPAFYIILFITLSCRLFSQVNWTAFENLNDSMHKQKKPLLIFVHTDWCKFCYLQDNKTFTDSLVFTLSKNFYCLRLNAETKTAITFINRTYTYKATGVNTGQHQLADYLAKEKGLVSYPTTILLNTKLELTKRLVGFYNANDLIKHLILMAH